MGICRAFRKRIKESIQMQDGDVALLEDNSVWSITSSSHPDVNYFVVRQNLHCNDVSDLGSGELQQPHESSMPCIAFGLARACRHTFSCGCHDYLNGHTCKHVLKVAAVLGLWNPKSVCLHTNPLSSSQNLVEEAATTDVIDPEVDDDTDQSRDTTYFEKFIQLQKALEVSLCSL
jgi:hypothetical protein